MSDSPALLSWSGRTEPKDVPAPLRMGDREVASVIGWGGLELWDPETDVLELCAVHARAVADFSCGQCVPCRVGSRVLAGLVEALRGRRDDPEILQQIRAIAETMEKTSRCDIGKTSPGIIGSILDRRSEPRAGAPRPGPRPAFVYRSILTAPCMLACPLHIDIPRYLERTANGRFREALETIEERLPLPGVLGRVCLKPCESSCRRGLVDGPIQIRHIKRFLADRAVESRGGGGSRPVVSPPTGARVAVIGAGPAGLTAAWILARQGHAVTVFEKLPGPGGMLGVAIPTYRLPDDVLEQEVKAIGGLGVSVVYGQALGRDFSVADLQAQGFRSVFLAVGTHKATMIEIEGDLAARGIWDCLDFLRRAKEGSEVAVGRRVVVLGGGNVAIDAARTALRLGAEEVRIVYRRTRRQMRALPWEIKEAVDEGISIEECWIPSRIMSEDGCVRGIEVRRSSFCDDARRDTPRERAAHRSFEADTVVFAIGMGVDAAFRRGIEGLELLPDGRIKADPLTLRTSVEGVFAGGDCVTGPNIVIQACAHGLLAGLQISRYLGEGSCTPFDESLDEDLMRQLGAYDPAERPPVPPGDGRVPIAQLPPAERAQDFREVESGFTAAEAVAEASRCLRCYRVVTCAYRE